jgi:hypothetical protein
MQTARAATINRNTQRYALLREDQWRQIAASYGIRPHWKNPTAGRPDYIPDYD